MLGPLLATFISLPPSAGAPPAGSTESDLIDIQVLHDGPLVLGEVREVDLVVRVREAAGDNQRPLRLAVNVGKVEMQERKAAGEYLARYTLPKTRHPQIAFVAVWRERGPDAPIAFRRIPLFGRTVLPVVTDRGAKVSVQVGEVVFGDVKADAKGRASIPIVVPPGLDAVFARSIVGKDERQVSVQTGVPRYNRLTLAVTPYLIPADGRSFATVHAFYDVDQPPPINRLRLKAAGGKIEALGQMGQRYQFRYQPDRDLQEKEITLSAHVVGDTASSASVKLALGTPVADRILIRAEGAQLVAGTQIPTTLKVLVTDRLGLGVPVKNMTATVTYARLTDFSAGENGEYFATLYPPAVYPPEGEVSLRLRVPSQQPPLESLVKVPVIAGPWPTSAKVRTDPVEPYADDEAPFTVYVQLFDAAGKAFNGDGVQLSAAKGAGQVGPLEPVDDGLYRATVVPERGSSSVALRVSDDHGRLQVTHEAKMRRVPGLFSLAPRIGFTRGAGLAPRYGLEVSLRPGLLDRRLRLYMGAAYRRVTTRDQVRVFDEDFDLEATLQTVPVDLGVAFDLIHFDPLTLYAGAAGSLTFYQQTTSGIGDQAEETHGRALGGHLLLGADLYGFFLEIEAGHTAFGASNFSSRSVELGLVAGYRWAVF